MKRLLLTTAICATLPFAAQADEFLVRADVTEATVFVGGVTEIVRDVSLTVPQGDHDVLLALPSGVQLQRADIAGTGPVTLGSYSVETAHPIEEGALDGPDVAAARARVEDLEDQVDAVNARIAEAGAAVQAAGVLAQRGIAPDHVGRRRPGRPFHLPADAGVAGCERDGLAVGLGGGGRIAALEQHVAEVVPASGVVRSQRRRASQQRNRLGVALRLRHEDAEKLRRARLVRVDLQHGPVEPLGGGEVVPEAVQVHCQVERLADGGFKASIPARGEFTMYFVEDDDGEVRTMELLRQEGTVTFNRVE